MYSVPHLICFVHLKSLFYNIALFFVFQALVDQYVARFLVERDANAVTAALETELYKNMVRLVLELTNEICATSSAQMMGHEVTLRCVCLVWVGGGVGLLVFQASFSHISMGNNLTFKCQRGISVLVLNMGPISG